MGVVTREQIIQMDITDKELREQLAAFNINVAIFGITNDTRNLYLKILDKKRKRAANAEEPAVTTDTVKNESANKLIETPSKDTAPEENPPDIYYGVAPTEWAPDESVSALSPYYKSKEEVVAAIKKCPNARFKIFKSQQEAEEYSKQLLPIVLGPEYSEDHRELNDPLPNVKTEEKFRLAKLIEKNQLKKFCNLVWSNPKYLLSKGVNPAICGPAFHRNALHCAADCGHLEICKEIMSIIESNGFWEMLYPQNTEEFHQLNKNHLVDLYLNMQDGAERLRHLCTYNTPLHLASMKGYQEIVRFLMTFPSTNTTLKNSEGKTASEVACTSLRYESLSSDESLKAHIVDLIESPSIYYVPIMRPVDYASPPVFVQPCVANDFSTMDQVKEPPLNGNVLTSPVIVHAYAGPLSSNKAKDFLKEWRSPSSVEEKAKLFHIKRSDPDRGYEIIGRSLAHRKGISWNEYWEFLEGYCNFEKPEGLQKLENHLKGMFDKFTNGEDDYITTDMSNIESDSYTGENSVILKLDFGSENDNGTMEGDVGTREGDGEELITDHGNHSVINHGTVEDGEDPLHDDTGDPSNDVDGITNMVQSLDLSNTTTTINMDNNSIYLTGFFPTKLDQDVAIALEDIFINEIDYPFICRWLCSVNKYTNEQRKLWPTPKKQSHMGDRSDHVHSISPLVVSSPAQYLKH